MRFLLFIFTISFFTIFSNYSALAFGPSNYWECILKKMPGTKNDPAAIEIIRLCRKDYPVDSYVKKKSPFFGVKTAGECIIKYGSDVTSERGARAIRYACYKLYPEK